MPEASYEVGSTSALPLGLGTMASSRAPSRAFSRQPARTGNDGQVTAEIEATVRKGKRSVLRSVLRSCTSNCFDLLSTRAIRPNARLLLFLLIPKWWTALTSPYLLSSPRLLPIHSQLTQDGRIILSSFLSPSWKLVDGAAYDVEVRDRQNGEGCYLQMVDGKNKNLASLPASFFTSKVLSTGGRFGAYGAPVSVKVLSDTMGADGSSRVLEFSFSSLSPTYVETPRHAVSIGTRKEAIGLYETTMCFDYTFLVTKYLPTAYVPPQTLPGGICGALSQARLRSGGVGHTDGCRQRESASLEEGRRQATHCRCAVVQGHHFHSRAQLPEGGRAVQVGIQRVRGSATDRLLCHHGLRTK